MRNRWTAIHNTSVPQALGWNKPNRTMKPFWKRKIGSSRGSLNARDRFDSLDRLATHCGGGGGHIGGPGHFSQGGGTFACPHLEQRILIVQQGAPSEHIPRP